MDLDSCGLQLAKSLSPNCRVGIAHGGIYPLHTRRHQRVGAWPGAPDMRAGLQVYIERRTPRAHTGFLERQHLGMFASLVGVESLADHRASLVNQHRAHTGSRRRQCHTASSKLEGLLHELLILGRELFLHIARHKLALLRKES